MTRYSRHQNAINEGGEGYNPHAGDDIRQAQAKWAAEWTRETTVARRAQWNDWARSLSGKVSNHEVAAAERRFGFTMSDLGAAIRHHGL